MTVLLVLGLAGIASWALRVAFITVIPASRLPDGLRDALEHGGVAVPAALVATMLARNGGAAAIVVPSPALLALMVSGAVAWRLRRLEVAIAAGIAAHWLLGVVWAQVGWAV